MVNRSAVVEFVLDTTKWTPGARQVNKSLRDMKGSTDRAAAGQDRLAGSMQRSGQSATQAAVNFQTMTQGMLNLTTAGVQTFTSMSNIDRAGNRLAQSNIAVARATDLLNNKELRLQQIRESGGDPRKVVLITKEIATARADLTVKTDKLKIEEGALRDVQLLFATNIANVTISSMQTITTLKQAQVFMTIKQIFVQKIFNRVMLNTAGSTAVASVAQKGYTGSAVLGSIAIKGLTFSVKGLLIVLGPIGLVIGGIAAVMHVWENDIGGVKTAMQEWFPFLRDQTALLKDTQDTIGDTTQSYAELTAGLGGLADTEPELKEWALLTAKHMRLVRDEARESKDVIASLVDETDNLGKAGGRLKDFQLRPKGPGDSASEEDKKLRRRIGGLNFRLLEGIPAVMKILGLEAPGKPSLLDNQLTDEEQAALTKRLNKGTEPFTFTFGPEGFQTTQTIRIPVGPLAPIIRGPVHVPDFQLTTKVGPRFRHIKQDATGKVTIDAGFKLGPTRLTDQALFPALSLNVFFPDTQGVPETFIERQMRTKNLTPSMERAFVIGRIKNLEKELGENLLEFKHGNQTERVFFLEESRITQQLEEAQIALSIRPPIKKQKILGPGKIPFGPTAFGGKTGKLPKPIPFEQFEKRIQEVKDRTRLFVGLLGGLPIAQQVTDEQRADALRRQIDIIKDEKRLFEALRTINSARVNPSTGLISLGDVQNRKVREAISVAFGVDVGPKTRASVKDIIAAAKLQAVMASFNNFPGKRNITISFPPGEEMNFDKVIIKSHIIRERIPGTSSFLSDVGFRRAAFDLPGRTFLPAIGPNVTFADLGQLSTGFAPTSFIPRGLTLEQQRQFVQQSGIQGIGGQAANAIQAFNALSNTGGGSNFANAGFATGGAFGEGANRTFSSGGGSVEPAHLFAARKARDATANLMRAAFGFQGMGRRYLPPRPSIMSRIQSSFVLDPTTLPPDLVGSAMAQLAEAKEKFNAWRATGFFSTGWRETTIRRMRNMAAAGRVIKASFQAVVTARVTRAFNKFSPFLDITERDVRVQVLAGRGATNVFADRIAWNERLEQITTGEV